MSITYLYYTQQKLKYQYMLCKTENIFTENPTFQTW